jgi:hypothetical protein
VGYRAGRKIKGMFVQIISLSFSMVLAIIAVSLPATSEPLVAAKVGVHSTPTFVCVVSSLPSGRTPR